MPQPEFIDSHLPESPNPEPDSGAGFMAPEDVRSEAINEIIGRIPHWIIRRGMAIIALLCLLMLTGAYLFKYPDTIPAKVSISSGNPPVKLVARSSLPIQKLFVINDQAVQPNQPLCVFLNTARYDDVMNIATVISRLDTSYNIGAAIHALTLPASLQLGELQPDYIELFQVLQSYKFFLHNNAYDATIGSLSGQIGYSNQLQAEQRNRQHLLQQQMKIQQRQFDADSVLLHAKIISRVEYEESQKRMLDQQMNAGNNKTTAIQNQLQESEYRKNIALTTLHKQSEEHEWQQKTKDAIRRFQSAFAQWEQNYVLKSPAMGKVSFFNVWKENQFVNAGEGIMMIIPPAQDFVVRGAMGLDRYGNIKAGQKALLKVQAYPYEEYGMLEASLTKRSAVPMDEKYAVEMKLVRGLVTHSGKTIPVSPVLEAEAEIITEDRSILERLFEKLVGKLR